MATEKRLIDANALVSYLWVLFKFFGSIPCTEADKTTQRAIKRCIGEVKKMPTVDAVEVVRCKDCEHWLPEELERCKAMKSEPYGLCNRYPQRTDWQDTTYEDDFCSYGERKTDG